MKMNKSMIILIIVAVSTAVVFIMLFNVLIVKYERQSAGAHRSVDVAVSGSAPAPVQVPETPAPIAEVREIDDSQPASPDQPLNM